MKLLGQNNLYDSLHWKEEVLTRFTQEMIDISKESKKENLSKRQFEEVFYIYCYF